jgi:tetrathionate reductase subunit B
VIPAGLSHALLLGDRSPSGCRSSSITLAAVQKSGTTYDATFRDPDGLVAIDQKKCIACGLCVTACPYGARYINPIANCADKCDLCAGRRQQGLQPACVEVCPTRARVFGKVGEQGTVFAKLSARKDLKVLKPELKTRPAVKYVGL